MQMKEEDCIKSDIKAIGQKGVQQVFMPTKFYGKLLIFE